MPGYCQRTFKGSQLRDTGPYRREEPVRINCFGTQYTNISGYKKIASAHDDVESSHLEYCVVFPALAAIINQTIGNLAYQRGAPGFHKNAREVAFDTGRFSSDGIIGSNCNRRSIFKAIEKFKAPLSQVPRPAAAAAPQNAPLIPQRPPYQPASSLAAPVPPQPFHTSRWLQTDAGDGRRPYPPLPGSLTREINREVQSTRRVAVCVCAENSEYAGAVRPGGVTERYKRFIAQWTEEREGCTKEGY
ncbi:hypothetical protein K438DRAFT_1780740 [Mycena galopus ATCC 62051]|nr:hypothetical protein K438DRAFT_1780740 [Mycena galopus ATCC 62051]